MEILTVRELKNIINKITDDEIEIFISNNVNVCGNISELVEVEESTYGSFGVSEPCLILYSSCSDKQRI